MNHKLLLLFLFIIPINLIGQVSKGRIIDAKTEHAIGYANVFLNGSQVGTITNKEGYFQLDSKGNIALPLIVSCIGYQSLVVEPELLSARLKILLNKKIYHIDEVNINSKSSSWSRKKMVRVFKDEFIGTTRIAQTCDILNIDKVYLYFNDETKKLYAKCNEPILIRNKFLGYNLSFILEEFVWTETSLRYLGYPSFSEHKFDGQREVKKVEKRRRLAFTGSLMEFFRYLKSGRLDKSRYLIYDDKWNPISIIEITDNPKNPTQLCYSNTLNINYAAQMYNTHLKFNKECIDLNLNGYVNPELFEIDGTMGKFRVGDMLPYDYMPEK